MRTTKQTSQEEELSQREAEILVQTEEVRKAEETFNQQKRKLDELVEKYKVKRTEFQKQAWEEQGIGWCHDPRCYNLSIPISHPQEDLVLLYTQREEDWSSERKLRSYCCEHADVMMSQPRGGKNNSQCYKAKLENGEYFIYVTGIWVPLPENTDIEIERGYISESEFQFGQKIEYTDYPRPKLSIGPTQVLD